MPARLLLRVNELVVDLDLENPSSRGDDRQVVEFELELFENFVRQTDGSRRVPSLGAVFD